MYYQSVWIRLAHRLYTDFQYFFYQNPRSCVFSCLGWHWKIPTIFTRRSIKEGNLLDQDHHHPCVFSCLEWHWTEAGVMFEWLLSVGLWRAGLSICGKDAHLKIPHSIITRKDPDNFYNAFHKWGNLLNQDPHVNRQSNGAFSYV